MSVKTHKVSFKQATALATLLSCTALYLPLNAEAAAASAKTSWAVSRVASESLGSYCTMAQKYSDDTVLTLAQNTKGEYSLAVDFKDQKFVAGKKQSVSINIDGGKTKTFDVMPQTENTVVLGIGKDSDFINQIKNAKKLSVKAGTDASEFGLSEVASGQKELGSCIEALQKPADKPVDRAANVPAEKTVSKSAAPVIHKNEVSMKPADIGNDKEPSVEGLLAAMPKPSADITPVQEDIVPVSPMKSKIDAKADKATSLQVEVASLRDENVRLSRALSEQRKSFEDKQLNSDGAAVNEIREKLEASKAQNQLLADQVSKLNAKDNSESLKLTETVKSLEQENQTLKNQVQIAATAKDTKAANADAMAKLQTENTELKQAVSDLKTAPKPVAVKDTTETVKLTESLKALQQENQTLKNQIQIYANVKDTKATSTEALAKLQTENAELKQAVTDLKATPKTASVAAVKETGDSVKLTETVKALQQENQTLKNQIQIAANVKDTQVGSTDALAKLQTENADLKQVVADLKAAPKETAVASGSDDEVNKLRADNRKLTSDLELAKTEKTTFQTQVASLQKDLENKQLKASGGSWDLEQATRRYQESQREIVRLGSILQTQDVKCANEKKDIEYMLFDPAIATKAQIAMLNSMEDQIKDKDAQLKSSGLASAKVAESPEKDAELASLKASLAQTQAQLASAQNNVQKVDVQSQAQQGAAQASALASMQQQVQQSNQTIRQLQNQISASNQPSVQTASLAAVAPAVATGGLVQQANFTPSQPIAQPTSAIHFRSIEEFSNLLKNAGVSVRGPLQQVKGGDPATYRAYSWKTDSLYGSAEMKKVSDPSQFEATVDQYLSRAKSRCTGEFAAVPSPVKAANMDQSKAFEIACVGQSASSSASVLFTYGNQIATTIAHEGRAEAMDLAIDARDKVSSKIN